MGRNGSGMAGRSNRNNGRGQSQNTENNIFSTSSTGYLAALMVHGIRGFLVTAFLLY